MTERVYEHSVLWSALSKISEVSGFALPFVFFAISIIIFRRFRGGWSIMALIGAVESLVARFFFGPISFITLPEPQPVEGQNPLALILSLYGINLGYLLFAIGVLGFVLRRPDINPASKAGETRC